MLFCIIKACGVYSGVRIFAVEIVEFHPIHGNRRDRGAVGHTRINKFLRDG